MRKILAAAAALGVLGPTAQAATFTVQDVVQSPTLASLAPFPATSFSIADSAVQSGSFSIFVTPTGVVSGDGADFVSFTSGSDSVSANGAGDYYGLSIKLTFSSSGSIDSSLLSYNSPDSSLDVSGGAGGLLSGNYDPSPGTTCFGGSSSNCAVTAQLVQSSATSLPEPSSALLLLGVVGGMALAAARRRPAAWLADADEEPLRT